MRPLLEFNCRNLFLSQVNGMGYSYLLVSNGNLTLVFHAQVV